MKAALSTLVARKREHLRSQQEAHRVIEASTTESWSGLRITERCMRPEKLDSCMRGKELIPISGLGALVPTGRDQVVIGVICAQPSGPKIAFDNRECAEWTLTDVDPKAPQQAKLVLYGRAIDYWVRKDGVGHAQAKVGSIVALLNPKPSRRSQTLWVSIESQVVKLGTCPALSFCIAKVADGLDCGAPCNKEGSHGGYCARHAAMSPWARQESQKGSRVRRQVMSPTRSNGSRTVASPLRGLASAAPPPDALSICSVDTLRMLEGVQRALEATPLDAKELLRILRSLEAADVDGPTLRCSAIYNKMAQLAQRNDAVGSAAMQLRRRWRISMDSASGDIGNQTGGIGKEGQRVLSGEIPRAGLPDAKRARVHGSSADIMIRR